MTLVVRDYDESIAWYTGVLGFTLVADIFQPEQDKRWVLVAPPGAGDDAASLLLARASTPSQEAFIGNQAGGRVFLFLHTDDFWRDFRDLTAKGVRFVRPPAEQPYGTVAVFEDLYGNLWDLVELAKPSETGWRAFVSGAVASFESAFFPINPVAFLRTIRMCAFRPSEFERRLSAADWTGIFKPGTFLGLSAVLLGLVMAVGGDGKATNPFNLLNGAFWFTLPTFAIFILSQYAVLASGAGKAGAARWTPDRLAFAYLYLLAMVCLVSAGARLVSPGDFEGGHTPDSIHPIALFGASALLLPTYYTWLVAVRRGSAATRTRLMVGLAAGVAGGLIALSASVEFFGT